MKIQNELQVFEVFGFVGVKSSFVLQDNDALSSIHFQKKAFLLHLNLFSSLSLIFIMIST